MLRTGQRRDSRPRAVDGVCGVAGAFGSGTKARIVLRRGWRGETAVRASVLDGQLISALLRTISPPGEALAHFNDVIPAVDAPPVHPAVR